MSAFAFDSFYNYLWPQYTLPWNNSYAKLQQESPQLSTQLKLIDSETFVNAKSFDSEATLLVYFGGVPGTCPNLSLSNFDPTGAVSVTPSATKNYLNIVTKTVTPNIVYNYAFSGNFQLSTPITIASSSSIYLAMAFNLDKILSSRSQFVDTVSVNGTEYTQISGCLMGPNKDATVIGDVYSLDECSGNPSTSSFYALNGNKLYLMVPFSNSSDSSTSISTLMYDISVQVVEVLSSL